MCVLGRVPHGNISQNHTACHNQDTGVDITHVDLVQSSPVLFVQVCVCMCVCVSVHVRMCARTCVLSSTHFFLAVPHDF